MGTVADWVVAFGTLVLAAVAVFQETIRGWLFRPRFQISAKTEPPDCHAVPFTRPEGTFLANSIYLRVWVENVGRTSAKNVEVYAKELRRRRADGSWERVASFPPMNLVWSNIRLMFFPTIAPQVGKHCDIGHIVDPAGRHLIHEDAPALGLTNQQTSLAFDLIAAPNHKGHIVGPGEYRLEILIAAENARPMRRFVLISLRGTWDADEARMLRDGVGITVQEA